MVIQRSDRVLDVLRRDEGLLAAFIAASPIFENLRNPLMRKTMGRLATVEQAALVAGIDPDVLTDRLNRALEASAEPDLSDARDRLTQSFSNAIEPMGQQQHDRPDALRSLPADRLIDLDVRDDLRNGREPFSRIMAARAAVPENGVLRLRTTFEPVPLYRVMAGQGFDHWTEQLAGDDWCVWFYHAKDAAATPRPATEAAPPSDAVIDQMHRTPTEADEPVTILDVRGMDPPEPMVRTLAALDQLREDETLLQINDRVPQHLLPKLNALGFDFEIREQSGGPVRVYIRRSGGRQGSTDAADRSRRILHESDQE
jgi:uncharacterized protein (DUF2249 family)